jgi:hypothetical protein
MQCRLHVCICFPPHSFQTADEAAAGPSAYTDGIADGIADSTATAQAELRTPAYTPRDTISVGAAATGAYFAAAPVDGDAGVGAVGDAVSDAGVSGDGVGAHVPADTEAIRADDTELRG